MGNDVDAGGAAMAGPTVRTAMTTQNLLAPKPADRIVI
jgi:hypothetical protein